MTLNDPYNLVSKFTPLVDTEYLTSGYIYGHRYYGKRIPYPSFQMLSLSMTFSDL